MTLTSEEVVSNLSKKKSGIIDVTVNGIPSTVYYGPIKHVDWFVAIVVER